MSICACSACGQFFVTQESGDCSEPCRQCGQPLRTSNSQEMRAYVQGLTAKARVAAASINRSSPARSSTG